MTARQTFDASPAIAQPSDSDRRVDDQRSGILLVGHGTRDPRGTREFLDLAEVMGRRTEIFVQPCLLEFQSPTIAEAWHELMRRGIQNVQVTPLLLFAAGHAKEDIPEAVAEVAKSYPDVVWRQSRPISRAAAMVDLVCERIEQSLEAINRIERTAVLMVGRGSRDPCARSDMLLLTEVVARRFAMADRDAMKLPSTCFHTAFYAMTTPTVPQMLDQIAVSGDYDRIVVHPHLLFSGRLYDAIEKQCVEAAERHRSVDVICGPYLGPNTRVADAVLHRIGSID